jgi:hypothetical protein
MRCKICRQPFKPQRSDAKTCSDACRQMLRRRRLGVTARHGLKRDFQRRSDYANEWYTEPQYIEAAKKVLGKIDLDPASSDTAQETVRAQSYYTRKADGLAHGTVVCGLTRLTDRQRCFCGSSRNSSMNTPLAVLRPPSCSIPARRTRLGSTKPTRSPRPSASRKAE